MPEKLRDKIFGIFLTVFEPLALFGIGIFFGVGGLFIQPKLSFFIMGFLYGAFLGFAAFPVFDSDKWASKPLICAVLGGLLTAALAAFLDWSITKICFAGIGGLVMGYFAPVWAKYM